MPKRLIKCALLVGAMPLIQATQSEPWRRFRLKSLLHCSNRSLRPLWKPQGAILGGNFYTSCDELGTAHQTRESLKLFNPFKQANDNQRK